MHWMVLIDRPGGLRVAFVAVAGPLKEAVDHAVERHVGVGQRVRHPGLAEVAGKAPQRAFAEPKQ